ncbi:unknown protein [Seminavis robusta]|uniref:Uncharacterized protein n=1 Tax=Seminavis robusta TaxID=568900 RepID=A0A9N8HM67_9STRA|nr:unknown protein [Seminavis robusta]|eukprot:Sro722_g192930.1 n/a (104) ;mRNA; f:34117-34428
MQLAVTVDATYEYIYMSGDYTHHYIFPSFALFVVWNAGVMTIKNVIADINNDGNAGDARVPEYRRWLALVRVFGLRWGGGVIPGDIKAAVNDVETNIGVHVTD